MIPYISLPVTIDHYAYYRPCQKIESSANYSNTQEISTQIRGEQFKEVSCNCSKVNYWDPDVTPEVSSCDAPASMTKNRRGRPPLKIDHDKILKLKTASFSNRKIAEILGTNERQVYRILKSLRGRK